MWSGGEIATVAEYANAVRTHGRDVNGRDALAVLLVWYGINGRLGDGRVLQQDGLDLVRRDLLAAPIDDLLETPDKSQVGLLIESADVARPEPPVPEADCIGLR